MASSNGARPANVVHVQGQVVDGSGPAGGRGALVGFDAQAAAGEKAHPLPRAGIDSAVGPDKAKGLIKSGGLVQRGGGKPQVL